MKFVTDRLILMPISADQFDEIYVVFTNDFVKKYLFDDEVLSEDSVQSFIETSIESFQEKQYGLWTIHTKGTNTLIGFTGLWHFFDETQPQLLYALLPQFTNMGYAKEAAQKIIEYTWKNLHFDFLEASCDTPNTQSQQTAIRLGMKKIKEEIIDDKPITFFRINKNEQ
jgi:[ribosomal protein S5]-alanine N-acetyltransferase